MLLASSLYLKMLKFESKSGHYIFVTARYRSNAWQKCFLSVLSFCSLPYLKTGPRSLHSTADSLRELLLLLLSIFIWFCQSQYCSLDLL